MPANHAATTIMKGAMKLVTSKQAQETVKKFLTSEDMKKTAKGILAQITETITARSDGPPKSKKEVSITVLTKVAHVVVQELSGKVPVGGPLLAWGTNKAIDKGAAKLKKYLQNRKAGPVPVDATKYDSLDKVEEAVARLKKTVPDFQANYKSYAEQVKKAENPKLATAAKDVKEAEAYVEGLLTTWQVIDAKSDEILADLHGIAAYFTVWAEDVSGYLGEIKKHTTSLHDSLPKMMSTEEVKK